ncbi:MAG: type II and III secretion system protein family protein [Rickettsiales bacterium]|nr:type II and III secretion system protein family protein [Rickettsiales bacterium]
MFKTIKLVPFFIIALAASANAATTKFYVPVNRSEIVTSSVDLGEVIVSNPDIADIYVHGKDKLSIIGKTLGETSVRLFDENNRLIRDMDVMVTYDLPAIRRALHDFLPNERIGVEMVNTKVALTGEVSSSSSANTALEIATQFLNPVRDANEELDQQYDSKMENNNVINLMKVSAGQQVMLRIRIGEVQRGTLKQLGIDFDAIKGSGDVPFQILSSSGIAGLTSLGVSYTNSSGQNSISATIDALEQDNLLKVLAEPNLVALSGEEAEFLAGGEVPIPVAQSNDTITVDYKTFGVSVRFRPFVLTPNRIRIQVQPEVSERNDGDGVDIGGGAIVPAFDVRRASTTIELAPGESFMIAGLIQDNLNTTINQLPGVSEIPILSSLFRNTSFERQETELVLAVTPYLVDPLKSSDVRMPSDDFRPASTMESLFYGALGSLSGNASNMSQSPSLEGPIGFMVD